MLQRAASNAYSWWWASHIRTKQSKWLEENLQDLEEKVQSTLKILDSDGESFAQRAETYFRMRPELIDFVEEAFRAYRALAERYDHLSRELQNANRTIATVFPERVQYATDDNDTDDYEGSLPGTPTSYTGPKKPLKYVEADSEPSTPKVPRTSERDSRSHSMLYSRKGAPKSTTSAVATSSSGLSKNGAVQEIEKLQKDILAMQTEKEFVQSLYEREYQRYWEIENQIDDMQKRVTSLQDEFGIGVVLDDEEARTLMAATALKSCEKTLVKLQEKQEQSADEARVEHQRIKDINEKFELKDEHNQMVGQENTGMESKNVSQEITSEEQEKHEAGVKLENVKEQPDVTPNTSLTVMELVEKIDELVNKVVTLETSVLSQTALVERLRSETDEVKKTLVERSESKGNELKELEEELREVKNLKSSLQDQNKNLSEDSRELDHLPGKSQNAEQYKEEAVDPGLFQEVKAVSDAKPGKMLNKGRDMRVEKEEKKDNDILGISNTAKIEDPPLMLETPQEPIHKEKDERQDISETADSTLDVEAEVDDQTIWKKLLVKGLEEREKLLLEEYISVLHNYKLLRRKLTEVENKNRDSIFEQAMQIRELKSAIASKDEMIQTLLEKLSTSTIPEYKIYINQERIDQAATLGATPPPNSHQQTLSQESIGQAPTSGDTPPSNSRQQTLSQERSIGQAATSGATPPPYLPSYQKTLSQESIDQAATSGFTPPPNSHQQTLSEESIGQAATSWVTPPPNLHRQTLSQESIGQAATSGATPPPNSPLYQNTLSQESIGQAATSEATPPPNPHQKIISQGSIGQAATSESTLPLNSHQKTLSDLLGKQYFESTETAGNPQRRLKRCLAKGKEVDAKVNPVDSHHDVWTNVEKFRSDIDDLLEENLEFWLRFSTSINQIQKFQTSIQDLQAELLQIKEKKKEGSGKHRSSHSHIQSDIKPIYRHLKETQTELSLWLEQSAVLKDEVQGRFLSLCNLQDEVSMMSMLGAGVGKTELREYQAARLQGEVLNMKQENKKVSTELQAGFNRVTALKAEVDNTLAQIDDEFGISASKKYSANGARVPLRSFLFGVKLKKQKPFPCVNPALQKQYSDLVAGFPM